MGIVQMQRSRSSASFSGQAQGSAAAAPAVSGSADEMPRERGISCEASSAAAASAKNGANLGKRTKGYLLRAALALHAGSVPAVVGLLFSISALALAALTLLHSSRQVGMLPMHGRMLATAVHVRAQPPNLHICNQYVRHTPSLITRTHITDSVL